ncbi:MAG: SNF2-related protein [Candidatus Poribacteria bacterium]|nr:SNF2-related protein [Candidatus Poribacteria bacterium]
MPDSIDHLLKETSKQLARFLGSTMPPLFTDWWNDGVINILSFEQRRRVKELEIDSLTSLDLATLLKVFDQNWHQISSVLELSSESCHFVKEMRMVRNRWAHAGSDGFSADDVYRDLDTMQRFSRVINADETLIQEILAAKDSARNKIPAHSKKYLDKSSNKEIGDDLEFQLGQIVAPKTNSSIRGAVVSVIPGKLENRIVVFSQGETQTYYASQLKVEELGKPEIQLFPRDEFHSYLTSLQILHPGLSTLYSLNAARVDFIPYQFRPVLRFIRSDRPRLLIADSVGVGKTIEAGLILQELQARRNIRSILIICPRPLITERKWELEMKRFGEHFIHLDGKTLKYCIREMDMEGSWPERYQRTIIPYSLFDDTLLHGSSTGNRKRRKGILDLDPPPRFDLVIVDEAHHIRNQDTLRHEAVRFFCDHAEAAVFLTATPIQLGNQDLFVLLNALRPDLVIDQESFRHLAEPNPFINQAVAAARGQKDEWTREALKSLDQAIATPWGQSILKYDPEFNRIRESIAGDNMNPEKRVQLITDIEELHTFSGIINRTRRRDIENFTIRKPETIVVEFTPQQKEFHDELLRVQAKIFSRIHGDMNVNFMMTTIRRQAASCLFGLVPLIQKILTRHFDDLSSEEVGSAEDVPRPVSSMDEIEPQINSILEMARSLDPHDPKLESLRKTIKNKQLMENNKLILFSSFRHTLHYLYEKLKGDGFRVGMIHGGTPDEERIKLRNFFELPKDQEDSLDVLLFSEIGCEGLDYQFCDCIVNYDLPWNPMRVEQRIGRIDRKGQMSETVAILNLITPNTVDADIYERCLLRIGVFNSALGGSEEILGEITQEIRNIAENFSLSDTERKKKLQQLADNKIRLIQEQEELEEKQLELFGIRLPQDQIKREIEHASSFWLSSSSILNLVTIYLQQNCGQEQEFILGEKPLKTLRLSQEARRILLRDFQKLPRRNTVIYREWENWLKEGNPHLPVTFESECAAQHPQAVFIMPLHPLVKQAAAVFNAGKLAVANLKVTRNDLPEGKYEFAIYKWQFHGIREDMVLRPVASSEAVTEQLSELLESAETCTEESAKIADMLIYESLDAHHYKLWSEARKNHRRRTEDLAKYRRESLATSHKARMSLLEEQLKQATNEKIQRMRHSQIDAAEADYARRLQDLDIAMEKAELTAEPIAYGLIRIKRENSNAE